jgi:multimeric flavodoxin WrbA
MKVLALNGSPRAERSSTYHILKPFLKGMKSAGAETEVIHIQKLKLKSCLGCYTCWIKTPGVCVHKDSMPEVIEKFNKSDLIIFGTPLYVFSMSGIMKTFLDRLIPRLEPELIPHPRIENLTTHPFRHDFQKKMFLISPCGFPEFAHFDSLVVTFKQIARMEDMKYLGEILCPSAEALSNDDMQGLFQPYYSLVQRAGEQLVLKGEIEDDLRNQLRQNLFPGSKEDFYEMANAYWKMKIED